MPKKDRQEPGVQAAMDFLLSVIESGQWVGEVGGDQWKRIWAMPWEGWTKPNRDELQAACALVGPNKRLQRILDCEYMKAWYMASRPEILHWGDWRAITVAIGLGNPLRMPGRVVKWQSRNVPKVAEPFENTEIMQDAPLNVPEKKKRKRKPSGAAEILYLEPSPRHLSQDENEKG